MNEVRLLIIDPDPEVRTQVKVHASPEGFVTDEAANGIAALKMFRRNDYNIIIMETEIPELDAWHVCRQIRKSSERPVIMLSKNNIEEEKLSFFDIGVDDFIYKPFSYKELMARVHVMLRHSIQHSGYKPRRIIFEGLCIDVISRIVFIDGQGITLTPKEYNLLLYMAQNPNRALSRETILNEVWGADFFGTDRTVDTHIKTLRENLKPYQKYIETVWGFGYIFRS